MCREHSWEHNDTALLETSYLDAWENSAKTRKKCVIPTSIEMKSNANNKGSFNSSLNSCENLIPSRESKLDPKIIINPIKQRATLCSIE